MTSLDRNKLPERAIFAVTATGPQLVSEGPPGASLHGLCTGLRGGVYTALRTFDGVRFLALEAHFDRLERNLAQLGFGLPLERQLLRQALDRLVRQDPTVEKRLRIDVLPVPPPEFETDSKLLITQVPHEPVPPELFERGVCVRLTSELKRVRPELKTTAWIAERAPLPLQRPECYEHVLVDEAGRLLECTSANFFGVRGGAVETIGEQVLEGIMRGVVYQLMEAGGVPLAGRPITLATYASLDEAFLTSSTRGILPVVQIEDAVLGAGRPGPVTLGLMEALTKWIRDEARPAVQ